MNAKNDTTSGQQGHSAKKILLVEDYEGNIVVALHFLQEQGYDVIIARNGKEALDKLKQSAFDIILMDVQMPIMDGYTATGIIKDKENRPLKSSLIFILKMQLLPNSPLKAMSVTHLPYLYKKGLSRPNRTFSASISS